MTTFMVNYSLNNVAVKKYVNGSIIICNVFGYVSYRMNT
jgi:hypothetical protein